MRCGASKNTSVRGSCASVPSAARRSRSRAGRKPSKQKRSRRQPRDRQRRGDRRRPGDGAHLEARRAPPRAPARTPDRTGAACRHRSPAPRSPRRPGARAAAARAAISLCSCSETSGRAMPHRLQQRSGVPRVLGGDHIGAAQRLLRARDSSRRGCRSGWQSTCSRAAHLGHYNPRPHAARDCGALKHPARQREALQPMSPLRSLLACLCSLALAARRLSEPEPAGGLPPSVDRAAAARAGRAIRRARRASTKTLAAQNSGTDRNELPAARGARLPGGASPRRCGARAGTLAGATLTPEQASRAGAAERAARPRARPARGGRASSSAQIPEPHRRPARRRTLPRAAGAHRQPRGAAAQPARPRRSPPRRPRPARTSRCCCRSPGARPAPPSACAMAS